jgi:hypothetical protein
MRSYLFTATLTVNAHKVHLAEHSKCVRLQVELLTPAGASSTLLVQVAQHLRGQAAAALGACETGWLRLTHARSIFSALWCTQI